MIPHQSGQTPSDSMQIPGFPSKLAQLDVMSPRPQLTVLLYQPDHHLLPCWQGNTLYLAFETVDSATH